jgi:hypothetical protein
MYALPIDVCRGTVGRGAVWFNILGARPASVAAAVGSAK